MDVLSKAIRLCRKTEAWLIQVQSRNKPEVTASTYDTLAPKCINDDNMQEYFRALEFALSKKEVRNIAITGNYGAGKSTVVSSFMKYHCSEKYINVSLAGFDMTEAENTIPPTNQEVELSILQQILYKENRDALPDSRIDRILNRSWLHTIKTYLSLLKVALPTVALFGIIFFDKVSEQLGFPEGWNNFLNENYIVRTLALTALAFISIFFLTQVASRVGIFDKKLQLGKIAFLSGDMEFSDKEPSSLFNNCLDEIVYFFSRRPYKIVVFEDLDRLGTPEIFVKLREINKIINNNRSNKNPVRFIYAVRDDLFLGADGRTKFFDFILPVIPFMDSRNAFTLLRNKTPSLDKSSDIHLKSIAPYLGDMRSLQNIVNEFHTFSKVVDNSINKIKLFSLVFYKNIYALDYHLADKKTGLLYLFIHNYRTQKLHAEYFESLDEKLDSLFETATKVEEEIANTPSDIRKKIVTELVPELIWGKVFIATKDNNNRSYPLDSSELVKNEEYFIEGFTNRGALFVGYPAQYGLDQFVPVGVDNQKNIISNYYSRVKLIGEDKNKSLNKIHSEIRNVENMIRARNATPLDELIKSGGREKFELTAQQYLDEMEKHEFITHPQRSSLRTVMQYGGLDALYVLLSNGLIMQDFMSYRSIFHEGSMTVNDNDFIKAIGQDLGCEKSNNEFYIDDAEKVISELIEQNRIYSDGALHYQLITHIIDKNNKCFTGMVASLFRKSDQHIFKVFEILNIKFVQPENFDDFVTRTLKISDYLVRMLAVLKTNRESPFNNNISISVLSCSSPEEKEEKTEFRNYLHFLGSQIIHSIQGDMLPNFLDNLLKVDACYTELFTPTTTSELSAIRFIAENSLYQITKKNVGIVISTLSPAENELSPEEAQKMPWTLIHQLNLDALITYYTGNIDAFIKNVFIYSDESSDCIREMLVKNELSDESKEMIVKVMDFTLPDVTGLTAESPFNDGSKSLTLQDLCYQFDRVIPDWSSLIDYIAGDCNEAVLHEWVTKHASDLGKFNNASCDAASYKQLYNKIICNDDFDEKIYSAILASVEIDMEQIDDQLSVRNFGRLIAMKKLSLDEVVYQNVTSVYSSPDEKLTDHLILWFSQYKEVFMAAPDIYLLKNKDTGFFGKVINIVMFSSDFADPDKAQLVIHYTEYYLDHEVSDIFLPRNVAVMVINASDNIVLKARLLAGIISGGYRNRSHIAELCHKFNESDLSNVFLKRTQATITANNDDLVMLILEQSREAGIIRSFERRDEGKIEVSIIRDRGQEE
jgi:hypothetical protein